MEGVSAYPTTRPDKIVALVVSRNRIHHVKETTRRLLEEDVDQIVVVDNASDDGSREWLTKQTNHRLTVLHQFENQGGAAGFEIGLRFAFSKFDADWYVLMDDDARPMKSAVSAFRAEEKGACHGIAAAVYHPNGQICEMNRPWLNPFRSVGLFASTLLVGGRAEFHIDDSSYKRTSSMLVDGASFVGLFLSREAVKNAGFPDGRLFIYGDDVLYTLGLSNSGGRIFFCPKIKFEHDCSAGVTSGPLRPIWKNYYRFRNAIYIYRALLGPVICWALYAMMFVRWLTWARKLPEYEKKIYRSLLWYALRDAVLGKFDRTPENLQIMTDT